MAKRNERIICSVVRLRIVCVEMKFRLFFFIKFLLVKKSRNNTVMHIYTQSIENEEVNQRFSIQLVWNKRHLKIKKNPNFTIVSSCLILVFSCCSLAPPYPCQNLTVLYFQLGQLTADAYTKASQERPFKQSNKKRPFKKHGQHKPTP